jgi:hypothetical protein
MKEPRRIGGVYSNMDFQNMDSPNDPGYARTMEKEQQEQVDQERIADLEREVQRLKAKVEPEPLADDGVPITPEDMPYMPPKWRAVVIPILIGVGVLAAIIGATSAFSSAFDSVAKKAAAVLVPEDLAEGAGHNTTTSPPMRPAVQLAPLDKPAGKPVRAPGL